MTLHNLRDNSDAAHQDDAAKETALETVTADQDKAVADATAERDRAVGAATSDKETAASKVAEADAAFAKAIFAHGGQVVDITATPPVLYFSADGLTFATEPIVGLDTEDTPPAATARIAR